MKTTSKNRKAIALFVGVAVSALAIFGAEFSSKGETAISSDIVLDIDEDALIERAIEEMSEDDFPIEATGQKTIKIYDKDNSLVEVISLNEEQSIEDECTAKFLNQAEFLSSYGNTLIYQISE